MRAVLFIIIIAIVGIIAALATGFLNVRQIRGGQPPEIVATRTSLSAKGGRAPAFDVETGSVKVGTKQTNVKVPTLRIEKPAQNEQAAANSNAANNAM